MEKTGGGPMQPKLPPRVFRSQLCAYSCRWSPFDQTKLAVAQAQYFGLVGSGGVALLNVDANGIQQVNQWQTPDATYDVCFNEAVQTQLLSAGGDGTLKLWDVSSPQPVTVVQAHQAEVFNCEWSHINKQTILSASQDKTIKLWDASKLGTNQPVGQFLHDFTVYSAIWHPTHESIFGSCSGDQTARVWDLRSGKDVKRIHAHTSEVLSMDFNKYENFLATAATDNSIKVWDLRATTDAPIMMLTGHTLAVRRIKFSPFHANILASGSYDMATIIWDCNTQQPMNRFDNHSEFVVGLDFSLFQEGQLATASWDKSVAVYSIDDNPKSPTFFA